MAETILSILSLAIAGISLLISCLIFMKNRILQVKPVLIFSRRSSDVWQLQNVGNGPSLNLRLGEMSWDNNKWTRFTRCYPLAAGATVELNWIKFGAALAVTYEDVIGNTYTSYCRRDKNEVANGIRFKELETKDIIDEYKRKLDQ